MIFIQILSSYNDHSFLPLFKPVKLEWWLTGAGVGEQCGVSN